MITEPTGIRNRRRLCQPKGEIDPIILEGLEHQLLAQMGATMDAPVHNYPAQSNASTVLARK